MKNSDIEKQIADLVNGDGIANAESVVHEVIHSQGEIAGDPETLEFYGLCAHDHCYQIAKRVLRSQQNEGEDGSKSDQMLFSGFEYLRAKYSVEREGEILFVPLELLTDEEIDARADEMDRASEGCKAHANELRRYKGMRSHIVTPNAAR